MNAQAIIGASFGRFVGPASRLWEQLGTNRRAAGGLIVIAALIALYGVFVLDDANDAQRSAYRQEIAQTQRSLEVGKDKSWLARAKDSASLRGELTKRMWQFGSEGDALANLQDWINAAGREAGLSKLQVKIDRAVAKDLGPDTVQFLASIEALQTPAALQKFLLKIEKDPHFAVVQSLHVQQRPYLLQMTLVTYAKLSDRSEGATK